MNKVFLSKSRYCECVQCEKILWLSKYKPDSAEKKNNNAILETGRKVGEVAKGLFGDYEDIPVDKDINVIICVCFY